MKLLIALPSGDTLPVDVPGDMIVEDMLALARSDAQVPENIPCFLSLDGQLLRNLKETLVAAGVKENDVLLLNAQPQQQQRRGQAPASGLGIDFGAIAVPGSSSTGDNSRAAAPQSPGSDVDRDDPAAVMQMLRSDPRALAVISDRNPELADPVRANDLAKFTEVYTRLRKEQNERTRMHIRAMNADAFDMEAQKYIEEHIQQENIDQLLNHAMEHAPEVFGSVYMLYINCRVNGHEIKAFVDSGAQSTIISADLASRCDLGHLIDKRFQGIAKGVGTSKIVGKVHLAQLQIGNDYLPAAFTVLEDNSVDMLLGLDMLKRHQCIIDLRRNVLEIGTTGTVTQFLAESELPSNSPFVANQNNNTSAQPKLEDNITKLMGMGFGRSDAEGELKSNANNFEAALQSLLVKGKQMSG